MRPKSNFALKTGVLLAFSSSEHLLRNTGRVTRGRGGRGREEKRGKGGYAGNANARHFFHPVDGRFVLRSAKEFVKSLERLDSVPDTRLARSRATPRGKAAVSSVEFSKPAFVKPAFPFIFPPRKTRPATRPFILYFFFTRLTTV